MELDYDCLQKHRIRLIRMPSDGVDPSQLHGPCRVYRMGRPMDLAELRSMPEDLQREYLLRLRQRGGTEETAAAMLGTDPVTVRMLLKRHRVVLDRPNPTAWADFTGCGKGA